MRVSDPYRSAGRPAGRPCPRCRDAGAAMRRHLVGEIPTERCERCSGTWLTAADFNELLINSSWQRTVLASSELGSERAATSAPLRCPDCSREMPRANLGRRSGVMVDSCRRHGIWFDVGELRCAVGFLTDHIERAELDARIAAALAQIEDKPQPWHARLAAFLADLLAR